MKSKKFSNRGFSLIELIAVVVVLGLIAVIVTPIVKDIITENRNKLYQKQINGIVESAKIWSSDNISKLPDDGENSIEITLKELKKDGYVKKDLKNPKTGDIFNDETTKVIISNENGILNYNIIVE